MLWYSKSKMIPQQPCVDKYGANICHLQRFHLGQSFDVGGVRRPRPWPGTKPSSGQHPDGNPPVKNADLVYGAERSSSFTGLLGRMTMYKNYWLPLKGRLYAALRIRKQLIARPGQRVGIDSFGAQYNIDRGNQTLVLQREAEMHAEMDKQGLRWQQDKRNELFAPRKTVQELIDAMRTIRGEDMYLFDSETVREDTSYDGGRERAELVMTKRRELPPRAAATEVSAPTITLKLSRKAIEELQLLDPVKLAKLVDIIDAVTGRAVQQKAPTALRGRAWSDYRFDL